MWDEEIHKKIKDSADQYHPAYDDDAWTKMELLLDEHLPHKKDRRRIIYFLALILLLAGLIFFVIYPEKNIPTSKISGKTLLKNNPKKSQIEQQKILTPGETADVSIPVKPGGDLVANTKEGNKLKEPSPGNANAGANKFNKLSSLGNVDLGRRNTQLPSKNITADNERKRSEDNPSIEPNVNSNSSKTKSTNEPIQQPEKPSGEEIVPPAIAGNNNLPQNGSTSTTVEDKKTVKSSDDPKAGNAKSANSNINQKKTKKSFIQNFGIGLGIGPDVSAVKLSNAGKITAAYGAQLSYSFTNRFTLRTGFYVAKKIYSVGDDEYHVPQGSTWNAYLQSVDANCKVYEIPLTLSYDFGKTKNHNWFASAGLSSYFMKKESYVYYYKDPAGTTWSNPWSVTNQNKHYFSVLDISGGYKYSLNKRFSVVAEPYIKLPLSGIGLGKIKLNSAGVLFTIAVKPFEKK